MRTIINRIYFIIVFALVTGVLILGQKSVYAQTKTEQLWNADGALKILSIGNSLSVDATEYLYDVLDGMGVEKIVIGDLHIDGYGLDEHYRNAQNDFKIYEYRVTTGKGWKSKQNYSIKKAVTSEDWDYIVLQQSGIYSGFPVTYDKLNSLINIIKQYNSDALIAWYMVWAFQDDARFLAFSKYDYDQNNMYHKIISTVKEVIVTNPEIDCIIPVGTALQNARTSFLGDTLTRDGRHLSLDTGRYIAALTFASTLSGYPSSKTVFCPENVSKKVKKVAVESVKNAIKSPYKVKESQYTEIENGEYTITYHANGGNGTLLSQKKKAGKDIFLTTEIPSKKGYVFLGWGVTKNATEAAYKSGEVYVKNADVTLYAVWKAANYSIKYYKNGGEGFMSNTNAKYGNTVTLRSNKFERAGYSFAGWNRKADGTGKTFKNKAAVNNLTCTDGAVIKLYAQWKPKKYSITYYLDKGSNHSQNPASYTIESDGIFLYKPSRKGYTFQGWYTDKNFSKRVKEIPAGSKGNVKLYAKWKQNSYTIKYIANGGTKTMDITTARYGKKVELKNNMFTRKGYIFAGWNTKADGSGKTYKNKAVVKNLSSKNNATVKLYAQWKKI